MKKKPIVMMATTLIALLLLTPIVKAGVMHYWWDNVYYVDGTDIDYPHPDNVEYDISRNTDWTKLGYALCHFQINKDTTYQLLVGIWVLSGILGLAITACLGGGTMATFVGGVAGLVVGAFVDIVIDYYFVDERGCIWWWVSAVFVCWLISNLSWLGPLCSTDPAAGYGEILIAFLSCGYLRVGKVTFHDALGIVGPKIYSLTISVGSGGGTTSPSPGTYEGFEGASVTVNAEADSGYDFNHWILDGATEYGYSITVTMDSDHDLTAYFQHYADGDGGGSGPGGCPMLSVYDGTEYVEEGLLDIHNPDEEDVITSHNLTTTPESVEHRYLMRLTEHNQTHSHIDQVQLYATLNNETEIKLPLVSAVHSKDGDVLQELLLSDDVRADTLGADHNNGTSEYIDLKFVAPEGLEIEEFTFIIEGYNPIHKPVDMPY